MSNLKIKDAPLIDEAEINDQIKLPTGGAGNVAINVGQVKNIVINSSDLDNKLSVLNAATATKLKTAREIKLTGDVTGTTTFDGSKNETIAATLPIKNTTAGAIGTTYGDSVTIPQVKVDNKGLTLSVVNIPVRKASTAVDGIVQLTASLTDTSQTKALTASAGKVLQDTKLDKSEAANGANKLSTPRKIELRGDATGSTTFDGSKDEVIPVTLADVNVKAGDGTEYGSNSQTNVITVNKKGLVTNVTPTPIRTATTAVTGLVQLANTLTDNSATKALTSAQGKILQDNKLDITDSAAAANKLTTPRKLSIAGDGSGNTTFDGSKDETITLSLTSTGVTSGTFGSNSKIPVINVGADGRIKSLSTADIAQATSTVKGITTVIDNLESTAPSAALSANQGRILNEKVLGKDTTVKFVGDVTGAGTLDKDIPLVIANTGVAAGTYGSGTVVPTITTNSKGQLTEVVNTAIPNSTVSTSGLVKLSNSASVDMTTAVTPFALESLGNTKLNKSGGEVGYLDVIGDIHADGQVSSDKAVTAREGFLYTDGSDSFFAVMSPEGKGKELIFQTTAGTTPIEHVHMYGYQTSDGIQAKFAGDIKARKFIGNASSSDQLSVEKTVNFTGDVTGTLKTDWAASTTTSELTLPPTGVTSGIYGNDVQIPQLHVNDKGQITKISQQQIPSATPVSYGMVKLADNLVTTTAQTALSANQGKVLQDTKLGKTESAESAKKLTSPQKLTATGDATGSTTFDGSKDESINLSINTFNGSTKGLVPPSDNSTAKFLRADGAFAVPPSGGGGVSKEYVDTELSKKLGVDDPVISSLYLQNPMMLLGERVDVGGSIGEFNGSNSGFVPKPTASDTNKVLSSSGAWVEQSGGGGGVSKEYVDTELQKKLGTGDTAVKADTLTNPLSINGQKVDAGGEINNFSGSEAGLVPSATSSDANKVLSGSGAWVPQSGGSGGGADAETAKKLVKPDGGNLLSFEPVTFYVSALNCYADQFRFFSNKPQFTIAGETMFEMSSQEIRFWAPLRPRYGAAVDLGSLQTPWDNCYLQNAPIVTSDLNAKTEIVDIDAAERACAVDIRKCIKKYKLKSAVAAKGSEARYHFGVIAQEVIAVFEQHGLDAFTYGIVCYSEWEAKSAEVDGVEEGAGSAYAIRYDELSMFLLAAL